MFCNSTSKRMTYSTMHHYTVKLTLTDEPSYIFENVCCITEVK